MALLWGTEHSPHYLCSPGAETPASTASLLRSLACFLQLSDSELPKAGFLFLGGMKALSSSLPQH